MWVWWRRICASGFLPFLRINHNSGQNVSMYATLCLSRMRKNSIQRLTTAIVFCNGVTANAFVILHLRY